MNNSTANSAATGRLAYYIAKSGKVDDEHEYVFRVDESGPKYLIHSRNRADTLDTILDDMCANVYMAEDTRQLIEALFGESNWSYSTGVKDEYKYEFGPPAKRKYPEPPGADDEAGEEEPEDESIYVAYCNKHRQRKSKNGKTRGRQAYICKKCRAEADNPEERFCNRHNKPKYKNGKSRHGKQLWRCPVCVRQNRGKPSGGTRTKEAAMSDSWASARAAHVSATVRKNPKCKSCGEHLRIRGRHRNQDGTESVYYFCGVNACENTGYVAPKKRGERLPDTFEEVLPIVRKVIERVNGHHPQDRDDIVQEIAKDLWKGTLKLKDLKNRERMRDYVKSQTRLSQDKFERPSLDAPVRPDREGRLTFADTAPAADDADPHAQLEAKEAVLARLERNDEENAGEPATESGEDTDE